MISQSKAPSIGWLPIYLRMTNPANSMQDWTFSGECRQVTNGSSDSQSERAEANSGRPHLYLSFLPPRSCHVTEACSW